MKSNVLRMNAARVAEFRKVLEGADDARKRELCITMIDTCLPVLNEGVEELRERAKHDPKLEAFNTLIDLIMVSWDQFKKEQLI